VFNLSPSVQPAVIKEGFSEADIAREVLQLDRQGPNAIEKKFSLWISLQVQINLIVDRMTAHEEGSGTWSLAQLNELWVSLLWERSVIIFLRRNAPNETSTVSWPQENQEARFDRSGEPARSSTVHLRNSSPIPHRNSSPGSYTSSDSGSAWILRSTYPSKRYSQPSASRRPGEGHSRYNSRRHRSPTPDTYYRWETSPKRFPTSNRPRHPTSGTHRAVPDARFGESNNFHA
jgi:hypothetical protein